MWHDAHSSSNFSFLEVNVALSIVGTLWNFLFYEFVFLRLRVTAKAEKADQNEQNPLQAFIGAYTTYGVAMYDRSNRISYGLTNSLICSTRPWYLFIFFCEIAHLKQKIYTKV
jgi:hypothetical protein